MKETSKPSVKLVGTDGNAFAILGACRKAARKAGWVQVQIDSFMKEAMSGSYDNLLSTCCTYFNVK